MRTIVKLKNEINGENRRDVIASFEQAIADEITKATKEKAFFSLPLTIILRIISKTELLEQDDPISLIKTIITKTIASHSKEKETILLLPSLKTNDIELTLESCADILSLFTQCDICVQLHKQFQNFKETVDFDTDYLISQKEKEIEQLQRIKNQPESYEPDILIAAKQGKLTSVKYLVEKGADIESKDKYEWTPLHWACENGHLAVVKYLIKKGANIEAQNRYKQTPLHWASANGRTDVVRYLVSKGANKTAKSKNGYTPYDIADNEEIKALLK